MISPRDATRSRQPWMVQLVPSATRSPARSGSDSQPRGAGRRRGEAVVAVLRWSDRAGADFSAPV